MDAVLANKVKLGKYPCIDFILGLQKYDPHALKFYKTFTPRLQQMLQTYAEHGGALLISGSYIGSDMFLDTEKAFLSKVLKVSYTPTLERQQNNVVQGLGLQMNFYNTPNEDHYAAQNPEVLSPEPGADCVMQYGNGTSAAVAYKDQHYRCFTMGFPFECIIDQNSKKQVMNGILKYLLD